MLSIVNLHVKGILNSQHLSTFFLPKTFFLLDLDAEIVTDCDLNNMSGGSKYKYARLTTKPTVM